MPNIGHPKKNQPKNQPSQKLEAARRLWGYFVDKIAQKRDDLIWDEFSPKALYRSNLVSRFSTTKNPSVHLHFFPSFLSCWPRRTSQVLLPKTAFLTDLAFLKNICVSMSFIFRRGRETGLQKLRSS